MIRYVLAAQFLRAMSLNTLTKKFYRNVVGNIYGARHRARLGLTEDYIERSKLELKLLKQYGLLRDGARMLEVGTGWVHFFGLFPCLVAGLRVTLSDVWDCRQFEAFQKFFGQLETRLEGDYDLAPAELARAKRVLAGIREAKSFDDVYRMINAEYVIDPGGRNTLIEGDGSFDVVVSFHVLEHVRRSDVPQHLEGYARLLKPGGFQIHQIGIDDHLSHYDESAHVKLYLQYSDEAWERWFENELQYFNRIQLSEWISRFEATGMELMHSEHSECDLTGLSIHPTFAQLGDSDLKCTIPTIVLRKKMPGGAHAAGG